MTKEEQKLSEAKKIEELEKLVKDLKENRPEKNSKRPGCLTIILIIFGILLFIGVVGSILKNKSGDNGTTGIQEIRSAGNISEGCNTVTKKFSAGSSLTKIQREEAWEKYENKVFEWRLVVSDVHAKTMNDGYDVFFKCINSYAFSSDIMVEYPKGAEQTVKNFNKGDVITVKGVLTGYTTLTGLFGDAI